MNCADRASQFVVVVGMSVVVLDWIVEQVSVRAADIMVFSSSPPQFSKIRGEHSIICWSNTRDSTNAGLFVVVPKKVATAPRILELGLYSKSRKISLSKRFFFLDGGRPSQDICNYITRKIMWFEK